jgi:hypothetical protein
MIDVFGLGRAGSTAIVVVVAIVTLAAGVWWLRWDAATDAGNQATVEAHAEQAEFVAAVNDALDDLSDRSFERDAELASQFKSFKTLTEADWDADLQNSDDFVARANAATQRVYQRRQRRLQEIFTHQP